MLKQFAFLTAVVAAAVSTAASADADVRLKRKNGVAYFEPYYPGEGQAPAAGVYDYYVPPGVYDETVYYGRKRQQVAFDESYYNPYYLPPSKKTKKERAAQRAKAKAAAQAAAREAEAKARAAKLAKTKVKAPAASEEITGSTSKVETASTASSVQKKPAATAAVSCEKANTIVSGYGFATVEATKCAAPTYEFKATRDGKNFHIKVSSASGELTEVKKLN